MSLKNSLHRLRCTFSLTLSALIGVGLLPAFSGEPDEIFPPIQGWKLMMDSTVYTPDNLWNIINGAADAYLLYGFEDLHIGEYLSSDSVDVRAELYAHSSTANAFGIYSQERKPEYSFIDIGSEGYIEDGVLNFLCGKYYIKLTSHIMGAKGREALRLAAQCLDSQLKQKKGFPSQLALLPSEGKIQRSESYIADSYLGYSHFRSAFVAQYGDGGRVQLFVMVFDSPAAARAALKLYVDKLNNPTVRIEDGKYMLVDPNNGTLGMLLRGRHLSGVVNCEDEKLRNAYLDALKKAIKQH